MQLLDLNFDCLLKVLSYCDEKDLINLFRTHSTLRHLIDSNIFYKRSLDLLLCGHRSNPAIMRRTHSYLSFLDRLKIGENWLKGCYRQQQYFRRSKHYASKIHLECNWFYVSCDSYLREHKRLKTEPLQGRYNREISSNNKADIADFVKKNDTVFVGCVTGGSFIYEDNYTSSQQLHSPKEYLRCVDFSGNMYATSSECCKIWRREEEMGLINLELVKNLNKSFKTMRFNDAGDHLYGGLYTSTSRCALREIDLQSGREYSLNSKTYSISDLKLKDDNVILTANFEANFRLYDRRTNRDEFIWEDPFNSSFYCLEYDGLHAVLCGAKYDSRVNLYDIRKPGNYIQLYFPQTPRDVFVSSPVNSLACDSRYMFVAADTSVYVFDFKVDCATSKDYYNVFPPMNRIVIRR